MFALEGELDLQQPHSLAERASSTFGGTKGNSDPERQRSTFSGKGSCVSSPQSADWKIKSLSLKQVELPSLHCSVPLSCSKRRRRLGRGEDGRGGKRIFGKYLL